MDINCLEGSSVEEIIDTLDLPKQHLGIILLNGVHASRNSKLNENDNLVLLPIIDGG